HPPVLRGASRLAMTGAGLELEREEVGRRDLDREVRDALSELALLDGAAQGIGVRKVGERQVDARPQVLVHCARAHARYGGGERLLGRHVTAHAAVEGRRRSRGALREEAVSILLK